MRPNLAPHCCFALPIAAVLALSPLPAMASSILFVGNSFTYGEPAGGAPIVEYYQPSTVTDLNGTGIGGVPALFKGFTVEAGLSYQVSLETVPGVGLDYHYANKLSLIDKPWDNVVLQSYSTLDAAHPGNPALLIASSGLLARALAAQNPNVQIQLDATWSRADQTYLPTGHWYGQSIDQMAKDVYAGYVLADQSSADVNGVLPVGLAFNEAIDRGFADPNPYDGISPTQFNLWAPDSYHASPYGYYLEALVEFGGITGLDPRTLDAVASGIGVAPDVARLLQQVAADQLNIPEPSSLALVAGAVAALLIRSRRAPRPIA